MARKKTFAPIIALVGTDPALLRDHLREIKAEGGDSEDYDIVELEGADVTATAILESLRTRPLFSPKRLLIIRRAENLSAPEAESLARVLEKEKIPAFTTLVLTFESEQKSEKGNLLPIINRIGTVVTLKSKRHELPKLLRDRAASAGVEFEEVALKRLAELTWYDYSLAVGELEKLLALTPPGGSISKSLVEKIILPSAEWKVFDLLDAICAGRTAVALEKLGNFVRSVAKPQEEAIHSLLPLLHRQLSLLWQRRALSGKKGTDPKDIFPKRHNWGEVSQKSDFQRDKIESLARNLSLSTLCALFQVLADTDKRLKGALPSASPIDTIERMVLQMSECLRKASHNRRTAPPDKVH